MFFYYRGKNVLNQKTELQRALQRQKEQLAKKQTEDNSRIPELEKVIADRAKRLQSPSGDKVSSIQLVCRKAISGNILFKK